MNFILKFSSLISTNNTITLFHSHRNTEVTILGRYTNVSIIIIIIIIIITCCGWVNE